LTARVKKTGNVYYLMKRGLFIGRFEPLHLGHLSAILEALEMVDELVILIGSAQEDLTYNNCFHIEERKNMLKNSLLDAHIDENCIKYIEVTDYTDNVLWSNDVLGKSGDIDIVFSGNKLVQSIYSALGYSIHNCEENMVHNVHGTSIRKKILDGDLSWKHDVPKAVAKIIESSSARERIVELFETSKRV